MFHDSIPQILNCALNFVFLTWTDICEVELYTTKNKLEIGRFNTRNETNMVVLSPLTVR